ncbi:hypothetical protein [Catenuloplanes atrovinosus]|uniref:PE domain-containing protein n=1 Tax=Catenuloplanes atrovinosus TaxID=137266 RepID=A0AAE4C8I2_9ACTN|nr:hypothetical protein [Catenuloplanes atrovinosus]MDR7275561.1 hypothetical protein [Catenuloplanes atrovinosus]
MTTDGYRVDPGALEAYAAALTGARDAVRHPADRLAALAAEPPAPGAFAEAQALLEQHTALVRRMQGLTQAVAVALGFAEEVTGAIAAGYRDTDRAVADTYLGTV